MPKKTPPHSVLETEVLENGIVAEGAREQDSPPKLTTAWNARRGVVPICVGVSVFS